MGTVYRARDPLIERTVAIKTVSISLLQQEGADAESRFLREAQSAGRLSHPNIVTIYDVGEADGLAYIAMEYLTGMTLRDVINTGRIPLELVLDTAVQMAEALAFAHEHGVIHRDIKPANVVVTGQRGHVKLTDFGIAHLINSNHTKTGQMLGSPRYMSPEQAMGREIDGRSDIFSLGAVLYEMLTGRYAFDGDSLPSIVYRVISETPLAAESIRPHLPAELLGLLERMLNKNPEARPDAHTLVDALRALTQSAGPAAAPLPLANQPPRLLASVALVTPIGVLLLIGLGIIVIEHFLPAPEQAATTSAPSTTRIAQHMPPARGAASGSVATAPDGAGQTTPHSLEEPVQTPPPSAVKAAAPDSYLAGLDAKIVELRIKRTELLLTYTEQHPDVLQVDRQLDQLRTERRKYLRQKQRK
jgi:serine/threonine-protein kinase